MQRVLLSFLLNAYATALHSFRYFKGKTELSKDSSVLLLPPGHVGSLGDEAMMTGSIEFLRSQGVKKIGLISHSLAPDWTRFNLALEGLSIQHHSLSNSGTQWFQLLNLASDYDRFCCVGADVMDGHYGDGGNSVRLLQYLSLASKTSLKTTLLGFSFNSHPGDGVVQAFRSLSPSVNLNARDPVSQERLVRLSNCSVKLVADLAFLLHPDNNPETLPTIRHWISDQRAQNRVIIGINANSQVLKQADEKSVDKLIEVYVNTIKDIYSSGNFSFLLIPHDLRKADQKSGDIGMAEAIFKLLPVEVQLHCIKLTPPFTAAMVKSICGSVDFVLTGRMHCAIASLGQSTPAVCVTYQGKFEGLFQHFELDGMLINPEQVLQSNSLSDFLLPLIGKRDNIRKHIQAILPKIQRLSESNFE